MRFGTTSRFRKARGQLLRRQIEDLARHLGREITVLDVGGRSGYWDNVGLDDIASVDVLNYDETEIEEYPAGSKFRGRVGDARHLPDIADDAFDLVHSNSVIEHVGAWQDMEAMARELLRVGRAGWMQTPAWEFPVEPHFRVPFMHWFGAPIRRRMLWFSPAYRRLDVSRKRYHVDRINLMSEPEVRALFPNCEIYRERVVLVKSYVARWMPDGA